MRLHTRAHFERADKHKEIRHRDRVKAKRMGRMLLTEEILNAVIAHVPLPKPFAVDSVDLRVCQYLPPSLQARHG